MIKVGDKLPETKLILAEEAGPHPTTTAELFGGKKVVLFGVPGAFTPTCSERHLPGFLDEAEALKAKGVDAVLCLSVNDPFVMRAWGRDRDVQGRIGLIADGSAEFAGALGLQLDLIARGMGIRSKRFALVAEDGVVTFLGVEEGGAFEASRAEDVLAAL